jgi:hypothetical protein
MMMDAIARRSNGMPQVGTWDAAPAGVCADALALPRRWWVGLNSVERSLGVGEDWSEGLSECAVSGGQLRPAAVDAQIQGAVSNWDWEWTAVPIDCGHGDKVATMAAISRSIGGQPNLSTELTGDWQAIGRDCRHVSYSDGSTRVHKKDHSKSPQSSSDSIAIGHRAFSGTDSETVSSFGRRGQNVYGISAIGTPSRGERSSNAGPRGGSRGLQDGVRRDAGQPNSTQNVPSRRSTGSEATAQSAPRAVGRACVKGWKTCTLVISHVDDRLHRIAGRRHSEEVARRDGRRTAAFKNGRCREASWLQQKHPLPTGEGFRDRPTAPRAIGANPSECFARLRGEADGGGGEGAGRGRCVGAYRTASTDGTLIKLIAFAGHKKSWRTKGTR